MSVGGRVVETIVLPEKVWVNTHNDREKRDTAIGYELLSSRPHEQEPR